MFTRIRRCPLSLEHVEIHEGGQVYLCCSGWLPTSVGNLRNATLDEILRTEDAMAIRRKTLAGDLSLCTGCPYLHHDAAVGPFTPFISTEDAERLETRLLLEQRDRTPANIARLTLAYDRTCSLSCPSCRTEPIVAGPGSIWNLVYLQELVLADDVFSRTRCLVLSGSGDPFASKSCRDLLKRLRPSDYPQMEIRLLTNAQLLNPEAWLAIGEARSMVKAVEVSIDAATGETYELNRRGGRWSRLLDNLSFIRDLRLAGEIRELQFNFVIQANNWRELGAFVIFACANSADSVLCTPLRNWGTFSDEEFSERDVQQPNHPEHADFREFVRYLPLPRFNPRTVLDWASRQTIDPTGPESPLITP